jgi:hypothetical protein
MEELIKVLRKKLDEYGYGGEFGVHFYSDSFSIEIGELDDYAIDYDLKKDEVTVALLRDKDGYAQLDYQDISAIHYIMDFIVINKEAIRDLYNY